MSIAIEGYCHPNFSRVKDVFEQHMKDGKDANSQLCIYVQNKCVVDLWSKFDPKFGPDSLQIIFSSGKSIASIITAVQVEKGLLSFDDKVVRHWPEFRLNGKQDLTISDILRHEGGLVQTCRSLGTNDALPENIKDNCVGKVFEDSTSVFSSVSKRSYHATTRGSILNEIIRRVDPKGRTVGEILREDVKNPGICCGLNHQELELVGNLDNMSIRSTVWQSMFGRRVYFGPKGLFDHIIHGQEIPVFQKL